MPVCLDDSQALRIFKVLILCLIMLCGVIGNLLVIAIISKHKKMRRSTTNKFICNMAISDLLLSIVGLPIDLASVITDSVHWRIGGEFGLALCKILPFLTDVSTAVSIQTLMLVAFDRFYAVLFPLKKKIITNRVCSVAIVLTWVIAMVFYSPIFYTAKFKNYSGKTHCVMDWGPHLDDSATQKQYIVSIFVLLYGIPLIFIIISYLAICIELEQQTSIKDQTSCRSVRQARRRENARIVKLFITVVFLFFLSWLPLHVYSFFKTFSLNKIKLCVKLTLQVVLVYTKNLGSAGNPFVYFIFLEKYRRGLKNLYMTVCHRKMESRDSIRSISIRRR